MLRSCKKTLALCLCLCCFVFGCKPLEVKASGLAMGAFAKYLFDTLFVTASLYWGYSVIFDGDRYASTPDWTLDGRNVNTLVTSSDLRLGMTDLGFETLSLAYDAYLDAESKGQDLELSRVMLSSLDYKGIGDVLGYKVYEGSVSKNIAYSPFIGSLMLDSDHGITDDCVILYYLDREYNVDRLVVGDSSFIINYETGMHSYKTSKRIHDDGSCSSWYYNSTGWDSINFSSVFACNDAQYMIDAYAYQSEYGISYDKDIVANLPLSDFVGVTYMSNANTVVNDGVALEEDKYPATLPAGGISVPTGDIGVSGNGTLKDSSDAYAQGGVLDGTLQGDIVTDQPIVPPVESDNILDWLNSFWTTLTDTLTSIFVISDTYFSDKIFELVEQYPLFGSFMDLFDRFNDIFDNLDGDTIPKIDIWLKNDNSDKYDYGNHAYALDMIWYAPYKKDIDSIISVFLWVMFAWRMYSRLPSIIAGYASAEVNTYNIDNFDIDKAKAKKRGGK